MGRSDGRQLGDLLGAIQISDDDPAARGDANIGVRPFVPPLDDLGLVGCGVFLPRLDPGVLAWRLTGAPAATGAARRRVAWKNSPSPSRILERVIDEHYHPLRISGSRATIRALDASPNLAAPHRAVFCEFFSVLQFAGAVKIIHRNKISFFVAAVDERNTICIGY